MKRDFKVLIIQEENGFVANGHEFGDVGARDLETLREQVQHVAERVCETEGRELGKFRFSLSEHLRPRFPECGECNGTGDVDADYPAASFMKNELDSIDLTKKAKTVCASCEGTGVQVPGFGLARI